MKVGYSKRFINNLKKTEKRDPAIRNKLKKVVRQLQSGSHSKGMRLHKISTNEYEAWSVSLDMKMRALFIYVPEGIIFVNIGTHDEVYS